MNKRAKAPVLKLALVSQIRKPTLVPEAIHQDCVDDLRNMLREAEAGEINGLAYAVMYRERNYVVNAAGDAYKNPTFGLGMVEVLRIR